MVSMPNFNSCQRALVNSNGIGMQENNANFGPVCAFFGLAGGLIPAIIPHNSGTQKAQFRPVVNVIKIVVIKLFRIIKIK